MTNIIQPDAWGDYLYPAPDDDVLRNKFGVRDFFALRDLEYRETATRKKELETGVVVIERTYDAVHVKAIHYHLFRNVYSWAGQYRLVNMSKGMHAFARIDGQIDRYLDDMHEILTDTTWSTITRDAFVWQSAGVFAHLNQAHPFREGNGRTTKTFLEQLSEQTSFKFNFKNVSSQEWNTASLLSAPEADCYRPRSQMLIPVFDAIIVDRDNPATHDQADIPAQRTHDHTDTISATLEEKIELARAARTIANHLRGANNHDTEHYATTYHDIDDTNNADLYPRYS